VNKLQILKLKTELTETICHDRTTFLVVCMYVKMYSVRRKKPCKQISLFLVYFNIVLQNFQ